MNRRNVLRGSASEKPEISRGRTEACLCDLFCLGRSRSLWRVYARKRVVYFFWKSGELEISTDEVNKNEIRLDVGFSRVTHSFIFILCRVGTMLRFHLLDPWTEKRFLQDVRPLVNFPEASKESFSALFPQTTGFQQSPESKISRVSIWNPLWNRGPFRHTLKILREPCCAVYYVQESCPFRGGGGWQGSRGHCIRMRKV